MTDIRLSRRSFMSLTAGAGVVLASPAILRAAPYATQPIKIVVGTGPSGTTDLSARLIAPILKEVLGQPVIVENRPGAGSTHAVGLVAGSKPDGHTLHVSTAAALAVHATNVEKPADLVHDLQPIGMICDGAYIYTINKQVPAKTAKEFITLVRNRPGEYRFGGSGPGSALHLSGELFCQRTGTKMEVVHYNNAALRATDLLANQIQMGLGGIAVLGQYVNAGDLTAFLVASRKREELLPNTPTSVELGIPDLDRITNWFGLHGPKDMPEQVTEQVGAALKKALADPEVRRVLQAGGMQIPEDTPAGFLARMEEDYKILVEVSTAGNIRIE
ncbi:tripartite tricarboxylate transporter substrate binding protein [Corticibacterium sp. UT-5YL-CI-8]|nr:tripartite tricarboxylate transporter substrate binding protein [Tianweitania sp. UT-5YL-CI-8]